MPFIVPHLGGIFGSVFKEARYDLELERPFQNDLDLGSLRESQIFAASHQNAGESNACADTATD